MIIGTHNKSCDDLIRTAFTPEGLALLTEEERRVLEQITAPEAQPLWTPFPNSPQETAYWSPANEIYFGGAGGSGKSGLGVGLAITQHTRSLLLRRQATQAGELVDQVRFFVGARGRWRGWGKGGTMTMDDGRTIEIGGCDSEDDAKKYAGQPHDLLCVGAGTMVVMSDGTSKAVEAICIGDLVDTLEGPRTVIQKHPPQQKQSVRMDVIASNGVIVYSQIQSASHRVLTTAGWVSHDTDPNGPSGGTECHSFGIPPECLPDEILAFWPPSQEKYHGQDCDEYTQSVQDCSTSPYHCVYEYATACLSAQPPCILDTECRYLRTHLLLSDDKRRDCSQWLQSTCLDLFSGEHSLSLLHSSTLASHDSTSSNSPFFGDDANEYRAGDTYAVPFLCLPVCPIVYQMLSNMGRQPTPLSSQATRDYHSRRIPDGGCMALTDHKTYYEESERYSEEVLTLCRPFLPHLERQTLAIPSREAIHESSLLIDGAANAQCESSPSNCLGCYSFLPRLGDERIHSCVCRNPVSMGAQVYLRQPTTLEEPIPTYFSDDVLDKTPKCNCHRTWYSHPYTKETRQTSEKLVPYTYSFAPVGVKTVYDFAVEDVNHYITGVGVVNMNCFDEAPAFSRSQFKFISGWNRSSNLNQRCRILLPGNPPRSAEERWIVEEFAPWLESDFPNPARAGEIRWYSFLKKEGEQEAKLYWFDNGFPFSHNGEMIYPRSRTFIPARLSDNPILSKTNDYKATLQALPEPLRSQLLYGDFSVGTNEDPWQVIPTAWVREAQKRWVPGPPEDSMMTAIGVDPARGGDNATVIACRYGDWFAPLLKYPGETTPDGDAVASLVIRAHKDDAVVNIDVIGYGASAYDSLKKHKWLHTTPINNSSTAGSARDRSGRLKFKNIRAASYWKLREALDPTGPVKLSLPPDNMLLADLCVAKYTAISAIQLEEKREIIDRTGRSPDCADAVALCYFSTPRPIVGGFRVLYTKNRNQKFRVVVCSWLELPALAIEEHTAVVVGFVDLPPNGEMIPVPAGLDNMLEMVTVRCADLEPEETREKWGETVEPWGKRLDEIIASEEDGKQIWRVLFKHRNPSPQVMVFVDNGVDDRRALSAAYAVCDAMHVNRKESIWQTGGTQLTEKPPNRHVYAVVRAARHRMVE